jgi:predicted glycosyltransferase
MSDSSIRILICSHDQRGMGRASRALAIAARLAATYPACTILLATDLPIIGRFKLPHNVDSVRLPALPAVRRQRRTHALDLTHENAVAIRRRILRSVARTFRPNVVIIERDPCAHAEEIVPLLTVLRAEAPDTRVVWALPDVVGEPRWVSRQWKLFDVCDTLDALCDEVWIHGERSLFDQAEHYGFTNGFAAKLVYTGYLSPFYVGTTPLAAAATPAPARGRGRPRVLLTAGGGALGYPLVDGYLRFLEKHGSRPPFETVLVSGPMMPGPQRDEIGARAQRLPGVVLHRFSKRLPEYLRAADVVVSNGGYNIHCASMSFRKPAVIAPSHAPPNERLQRARVFAPLGVAFVPPGEVDPDRLGAQLLEIVERRPNGNGHAGVNGHVHGNGNGHANGHSNGHGYTNGNGHANGNGSAHGDDHDHDPAEAADANGAVADGDWAVPIPLHGLRRIAERVGALARGRRPARRAGSRTTSLSSPRSDHPPARGAHRRLQ